ncbi:MAG: hypothetical protein R3B06_00820 [Kofleriaceae bacterium]
MRSLAAVLLSSVIAAAACGGKSKGGETPAPDPAPAADPNAPPFDVAKVKAALAAAPGSDECGADPATTMADHFEAQRAMLAGDDPASIDVTFTCRDEGEGDWQCSWSAFTKPGEPDPDDPCAEGGGSGYIIMTKVTPAGELVPGTIFCNAPG